MSCRVFNDGCESSGAVDVASLGSRFVRSAEVPPKVFAGSAAAGSGGGNGVVVS